MKAPIPDNERERLQALERCQILDTPPEESYDRLTRLAAQLFSAPISVVSLVDKDRQFFKSKVGLDLTGTERDYAFCAHALLQSEPFVVLDASRDPRFRDNPLVTGFPGIRFYCGAPITTPDNQAIGTLCVIDTEPRVEAPAALIRLLQDLAAQASGQIAQNQESRELQTISTELSHREIQLQQEKDLRRESDIRAELALEAGQMGCWEWDAASRRSVFSPFMLRLFGYNGTDRTPCAFQWMKHIHPEDRNSIRKLMRTAGSNNDAVGLHFRVLPPGGELRWLAVKGHYRRDAEGRLEGANGVCWDTTERRNSDEKLRASEEAFRGISEASPVGIFRADLHGYVNYVNQRCVEIWALPEDRVLGAGWLSRIHPEDKASLIEGWIQANAEARPYQCEYRLLLDDGTLRWVHGMSSVLRDRDGIPIGTVGTVDDITDRKRLDEQRHASEELTRKILESSADCIKILDLQGGLLSMSPGGQRALGITDLQPFLGVEYFSLWRSETDRHAAREAFHAATLGGRGSFQGFFPNAEGELRWWDTVFSPILDRYGHPERILAISRDMSELRRAGTEQQRARELAEEANRAKSLFLANVSHELRTPLNGVLGMTEVLLGSGLNAQQTELTETVKQSGTALLALVNDLLDLSRVEAGKLDCKRLPFELKSTLNQTLSLSAPLAERKGLQLSIAYEEPLPNRVVGDCDRLRQILTNYLHNALKFTEKGGVSVEVRQERKGGKLAELVIDVHDTGKGIPEEAQAHLFKPFRQVDESSTREHGGIGLGLAIASRIAETMGGSVGLTSRPGEGSTFWVRLPLVLPEDERQPSERNGERDKTAPADADRKQPKVLVAEDNTINQKVALHFLAKVGCTPEIAADGSIAVRLFEQNKYDLILMDCQMPSLDGYEAARRIRQLEASWGQKRTPIIALTAHAMVGDRERCLDSGMDDYLSKPIALDSLRAMLAKWCTPSPDTSSNSVAPELQTSPAR